MLAPLLLLTLATQGRSGDASLELFKGSALFHSCQAEVRLMDLRSLSAATQPDLIDGSYCVGFINGFTGNLSAGKNSICTKGASMGTVVRAYVGYMEKNPDLMDKDRRVGLRLALQEAYPCPASGEPHRIDPATNRQRVL